MLDTDSLPIYPVYITNGTLVPFCGEMNEKKGEKRRNAKEEYYSISLHFIFLDPFANKNILHINPSS